MDSSDTAPALEKLYQAKVVEFQPSAGYALLATQSQTLPKDPKPRQRSLEDNQNRLSGGGLTATINGARAVWVSGDLQSWATGARAVWVSGNYQPVPQNTDTFKQIYLQGAQWLASNLGAGVKVAVIDTGLDVTHPAFAGSLAPTSDWYDFYDDDSDPSDVGQLGSGGFGHGTSVASIVLQVAPRAKIMPLRALGPDGSGDVLSIARAIDWAVAHGASVINLSLGSPERSDAIQAAVGRANKQHVVVVMSAGNEGHEGLDFPAADAGAPSGPGPIPGPTSGSVASISVSSVNSVDVKSSFANYAKALEVVAPGESVYSAAPGNAMAAWSGTSMSAPIVSGALALALGEHPHTSPEQLANDVIETADSVYNISGNKKYNNELGRKGRLDLFNYMWKVRMYR